MHPVLLCGVLILNVVYALTRNYYHKLLPSIKSLLQHNHSVNVYILAEDDTIPDLPCKANVINVSSQNYFRPSGANYYNMFKYINLLKVVYPSLLPSLNKVLHLEVDTIICDDLTPLWKTKITNKWFAACPEHMGSYKPFGDLYFNMGVALINLAQMRKDGIEPVMVNYLNTVPQPWADQDAWNKYALEQDKAVPFDLRYNETMVTGYTDNPAIVHYCAIPNWFEDRSVYRHEYLDKYRI